MKITFLGTGGGRFATISQKRMTGGFRIDGIDGKNFHVDPGPGALVRSYQFGLVQSSLDGVFISHAHTDHYTDGEVLIEAMTRGMTKEKGIVIGSRSVFDGFQQWGPAISNYHTTKSEKLVLGPNKTKIIGNLKIKGTKTVHGDPTCIGFQIKHEDLTISYTSDTKYFENLHKYHKGSDILIASVIRPGTQSIKGHMCTRNFIDLVNEVKPKLAIMTHFGFKMLNESPENEAKNVTQQTGVPTLAAFDGMRIDINDNVENFKVSNININIPNSDKSSRVNSSKTLNDFKLKDNRSKNNKKNLNINNPNVNNVNMDKSKNDSNNKNDIVGENKEYSKKNKKNDIQNVSDNRAKKNTFTKDFSYSKKR